MPSQVLMLPKLRVRLSQCPLSVCILVSKLTVPMRRWLGPKPSVGVLLSWCRFDFAYRSSIGIRLAFVRMGSSPWQDFVMSWSLKSPHSINVGTRMGRTVLSACAGYEADKDKNDLRLHNPHKSYPQLGDEQINAIENRWQRIPACCPSTGQAIENLSPYQNR